MNINTYLRKKYDVDTPTTMLRCEARAFGIPYPLQHGWLDRHGAGAIQISTANRLHAALASKPGDYAARGMALLLTVMEQECQTM